jgi:hypothetical protein
VRLQEINNEVMIQSFPIFIILLKVINFYIIFIIYITGSFFILNCDNNKQAFNLGGTSALIPILKIEKTNYYYD